MKGKIWFPAPILLYLIVAFFLIVFGIRYLVRDDKTQNQLAETGALLKGSSKKLVEYPLPPAPTPRLDELNKLVGEQLKKEAAEAEVKKVIINKKEK